MRHPAYRSAFAAIALALGMNPGAPARDWTDPLVIYADSGAPTTLLSRAWDGSAWGSPTTVGTLSANLSQLDLLRRLSGNRDLLLAVDSGKVLKAFIGTSGTWDAGMSLTGGVGTAYSVIAVAAREGASGEGLVVYRVSSTTEPRYRTMVSGALSSTSILNVGLPTAPEQILLASRTGKDNIALLARSGATLATAVWDGSAFGSVSTLTGTALNAGRAMDAAFETSSGDGLAVWSEGSSVKYSTSVSSSWSAAGTAVSLRSQPNCVRLVANPSPSSNAALLVYSTANGVVTALPWTGTAWGAAQSLDTSGDTGLSPHFDAAWQSDGSKAVVAWTRADAALVRSRTWDGTAWSSERTGPTLAANLDRIRLTPAPGSTGVLAACQLRPATSSVNDLLLYSATSVSPGTTIIHGSYASAIGTISLASPPSATYGTTDLTYGNNASATIAPGDYRDWTFGNTCTFNLSAGTYRFKSMSTGTNTLKINCDTSAGDIAIVVATGDVAPNNGCVMTTSGGGVTTLHVLAGAFSPREATLTGFNVMVYAGGVSSASRLTLYGTLWVQGAVSLNAGDIYGYQDRAGSPGALAAFAFTDGVPGSATTISSSISGTAPADCFEPAWAQETKKPRITRWKESSGFDQ